MTLHPGIRVEGIDLLLRNLRRIDKSLPKEMTAIHKRVSQPIAEAVRRHVPVKTGVLQSTIRGGGTQRTAWVAAGTVRRGHYAPIVHFGNPHVGSRAQPFAYDAITASSPQAWTLYEREVVNFLDRVWISNA